MNPTAAAAVAIARTKRLRQTVDDFPHDPEAWDARR
jgi:hypothetical protein